MYDRRVFVGVSCRGELWGLDVFRAVEGLGFDGLFTGEHLLAHRPTWDAITMTTALACATERIAIGPAATIAPLRHPTLLAKDLAGIDLISGGRLVVALGVGGDYPEEFAQAESRSSAGDSAPTRRSRSCAATSRASGSPTRAAYRLEDVRLDPPPPGRAGRRSGLPAAATRRGGAPPGSATDSSPTWSRPRAAGGCSTRCSTTPGRRGGGCRPGMPGAPTSTSRSATTPARRAAAATSTSPGATPTRVSPARARRPLLRGGTRGRRGRRAARLRRGRLHPPRARADRARGHAHAQAAAGGCRRCCRACAPPRASAASHSVALETQEMQGRNLSHPRRCEHRETGRVTGRTGYGPYFVATDPGQRFRLNVIGGSRGRASRRG